MKRKEDIGKVFRNGRSQAVRIPKDYRVNCDELHFERKGKKLILTPMPRSRRRAEASRPKRRFRSWKEYFDKATFAPDFPDPVPDPPPEPAPEL